MPAGKMIWQACEVLRKTYGEIQKMKDDFGEILMERSYPLDYLGEYSYGPKSLYIKSRHIYLFKQDIESMEESEASKTRLLTIAVLFYDEPASSRVFLKEEPELWVSLIDFKNMKQKGDLWNVVNLLKPEKRVHFVEGRLNIGGEICRYYYKDEGAAAEEWKGCFVGYPLTEINNKRDIEVKIIDRLFGNIEGIGIG